MRALRFGAFPPNVVNLQRGRASTHPLSNYDGGTLFLWTSSSFSDRYVLCNKLRCSVICWLASVRACVCNSQTSHHCITAKSCVASARSQVAGVCPVVGTDLSASLLRSREERIFLNFEAPSQCRGNVTSWTYCHYDSQIFCRESCQYVAKFIVYRRSPSNDNTYEPVLGSVTTKILFGDDASRFHCRTEEVDGFEIRENDVVSACVKDNSTIDPLYLVGESRSDEQNFLYQYNRRNYEDCTDQQLSSVDTMHNDFRRISRRTLHLYVNIGMVNTFIKMHYLALVDYTDVEDFCRAGSNPPASAPTGSLSGTYLDTNNTAMCAGHITSWHYCYYPSAAVAGQTHSMTVAAWRLEGGTYQLVQGTNRTLTLIPVQTLAKIFCVEEVLDPADHVAVSVGDVIGVVLPSTSPIPVISSNTASPLSSSSSSFLMRHPQTENTTNLMASEFRTLSNSALHLYAKLGKFVVIK